LTDRQVPLAVPEVGEAEIAAGTAVLERKWLTMGEETAAFEAEFAARVGATHAFAVSNCTAALHLALLSLGVEPGDEVIVPSLSFVATANAVRYCGATPVFVEITSDNDLNLAAGEIEAHVTPRTRGIIAVHHSGYPADVAALRGLAGEQGLFLVEDAAQAIGAARDGLTCGSAGDVACFSFYSTKNATTAEGGMVTTDRDDVAERVRLFRSHGMTASVLERDRGTRFGYDVVALGYNYRIDELRAALGRVQLSRVDGFNERRRALVARYRDGLAGVSGVTLPFEGHPGTSACHLMPALVPEGVDRTDLAARLRGRGIQTSVHYRPIHLMTDYVTRVGTHEGQLPRTEAVAARELTLPLFPGLTDEDGDHVVAVLREELTRPGR